jgi:hypothetical protein
MNRGSPAVDEWIRKNARQLIRAIAVVWLLLWACGAYNYPDAPITRCGDSFCGKNGRIHTAEEFQASSRFDDLMIFATIFGFLSMLYLRTRIRS